MKGKRINAMRLVLCLCMVLCSCSARSTQRHIKVAGVFPGYNNPDNAELAYRIIHMLEERGIDESEMQWITSSPGEYDPGYEMDRLKEAIENQPDVLMIHPRNYGQSYREITDLAQEKGVALIYLDIDLLPPNIDDVFSEEKERCMQEGKQTAFIVSSFEQMFTAEEELIREIPLAELDKNHSGEIDYAVARTSFRFFDDGYPYVEEVTDRLTNEDWPGRYVRTFRTDRWADDDEAYANQIKKLYDTYGENWYSYDESDALEMAENFVDKADNWLKENHDNIELGICCITAASTGMSEVMQKSTSRSDHIYWLVWCDTFCM